MKILLCRFGAIGDLLNVTPVIRCIAQQKGHDVHLLTKAQYAFVLDGNPYLTRLWTLDDRWSELLKQLRQEHFDLLIDLHGNLRSRRLSIHLRIKTWCIQKRSLGRWLYTRFGYRTFVKRHLVHRFFDVLLQMNVSYDGQGAEYHGSIEAINRPDSPFICINIGGSRKNKRIPRALAVSIARRVDMTVVLLGGADIADDQMSTSTDSNIIDLVGRSSFEQTASWIRSAGLLITGDTGLMHLGAALRQKMMVLWGATDPVFGNYPLYPDDVTEQYINLYSNNHDEIRWTANGAGSSSYENADTMQFSLDVIKSSINRLLSQN